MLTLQPSQLSQIRAFMTTSIILWYLLFTVMTCLDISFLLDLLPSWLKHLVAIPSHSDRSHTSSANDSLLEERSSSLASHKCPVNPLTGYVPGITVLPSPPPTYLSTTPKSAVHGYQAHEPFSFHRTPPLEPPIIFIPTTGHAARRSMNGSF